MTRHLYFPSHLIWRFFYDGSPNTDQVDGSVFRLFQCDPVLRQKSFTFHKHDSTPSQCVSMERERNLKGSILHHRWHFQWGLTKKVVVRASIKVKYLKDQKKFFFAKRAGRRALGEILCKNMEPQKRTRGMKMIVWKYLKLQSETIGLFHREMCLVVPNWVHIGVHILVLNQKNWHLSHLTEVSSTMFSGFKISPESWLCSPQPWEQHTDRFFHRSGACPSSPGPAPLSPQHRTLPGKWSPEYLSPKE